LTAGVRFAYSSYWKNPCRSAGHRWVHSAQVLEIGLVRPESGIGGATRKGLQPLWTVAHRLGPSVRGL